MSYTVQLDRCIRCNKLARERVDGFCQPCFVERGGLLVRDPVELAEHQARQEQLVRDELDRRDWGRE